MNRELLQEIVHVREKARAALEDPGHSGYLPVLIEYLELMETILHQGTSHPRYPQEERENLVRGFGRIALEDYAFSESKLCLEMLAVIERFAEGG